MRWQRVYRAEPGLLLALLVAFVLADIALRAIAPALSGSLAHTARIPTLIEQATDNRGLLFVGNSLTNNGVAPGVFARQGPSLPPVTKVVPDGSALWEWYCIVDNQVLARAETPSTVILGFAWHQLSDQARLQPSSLGAFFCRWDDLGVLRHGGMDGIDDITSFGLAKVSALFALRETLRNRFLSLIIPHYQRFAQAFNADPPAGSEEPQTQVTHTYRMLDRLIARLQERDVRVLIMAMPVRGEYGIDDGLLAITRERQVELLDYRQLSGISQARFLDSMHLDQTGAAILTETLVEDLRQLDSGGGGRD